MDIEWDAAKDAVNRAKHGIGLGDAARLDWNAGVTFRDSRIDYGEVRFNHFAMLDGRLCVWCFTLCNRVRRIISLRKANAREIIGYGL
jgi:uncharacterized protein